MTTADPYIGTLVAGRYLIERELGRGGIGIVYLARDEQVVSKPVVLKVLRTKTVEADVAAWIDRKFRNEIEALARVDHPGIVGVLDAGEMPDGKPYFVMQFVDGSSLRAVLGQLRSNLPLAAHIIRQLGQALTAAHDKGIFHRDLKPENVMVQRPQGPEYHVKIIDFGIARVDNPRLSTDSGESFVAGTTNYMAPEQLMSGPTTAAIDIYALGVLAYEAVTGQLPFKPTSMAHMLLLQKQGVKVAPRQIRPELPEAAEGAILKALAFDPRARYARARDFADAFARSVVAPEASADLDPRSLPTLVLARAAPGSPPLEPAGPIGAARHGSADGGEPGPAGTDAQPTPMSAASLASLEPVGGAVPLDSRFYVARPADLEFRAAISRRDGIVLVKGARQVGKTSLLARGLQQARQAGSSVLLTDLEDLSGASLRSVESFFFAIGESIADQCCIDTSPRDTWSERLSPNRNFERYLRREVLGATSQHVVWGLDEVDLLFSTDFRNEVFGLFRSWHNKRSLDPQGPWRQFTLALAYATEVHFFITDVNQSPFNVGTRLVLDDFGLEQVSDLNERYGAPLAGPNEVGCFYDLLGGNPYLVRLGLHEMAARGAGLTGFTAGADRDEGPFGDHLRRILMLLEREPALLDAMRGLLRGRPCPSAESFYRLRSAGIIAGESATAAKPRCRLYATYLARHLL